MSEPTDEEVARVVALAIGAAGQAGSSIAAWKGKVNGLIPEIAMMLGPGSSQAQLARTALGAKVIWDAEYLGYTYEESSTRCVARLKTRPSKWYPDGIEPLRTQRTDTALGRRQRAALDEIPVGARVIAFKGEEKISADGETVRILVHIEPIDKSPTPDANVRPPTTPASGGGTEDAGPNAATQQSSGSASSTREGRALDEGEQRYIEAFKERVRKRGLTTKDEVALVRAAATKGQWPPTTDTIDAVLLAVDDYNSP